MQNKEKTAAAFSLGDVMPFSSFNDLNSPGGSYVLLNTPDHRGTALIVWRMAGDERSPKQEVLAKFIANACDTHDLLIGALKDQHKAIDWLMAQLIVVDPKFMPTRSKVWQLLRNASETLKKVGA